MIEVQKQAATNGASADGRVDNTAECTKKTVVDDDVSTVSEEEQQQHEGLTKDASINRLAQA